MNYYAHTAEDEHGHRLPESSGKWQPLAAHLRNVAVLARRFAVPLHLSSEAKLAGLVHDLGKYRDEFQQYLRNERKAGADTHHAIYGAAHAFTSEMLPQAFAVAGHHAGLPDQHDLSNMVQGKMYDAVERAKGLLKLLKSEIGDLPLNNSPLIHEAIQKEDVYCLEFATRLVFSALVDADRLDTAHWPQKVAADDELTPGKSDGLLSKVLAERERKRQSKPTGEKDTELWRLRNDVFDACLRSATLASGFFSLTVPTGGGKTLSAMAFALAHAKAYGLRRIIVVIPFLSIIEQNARVCAHAHILFEGIEVRLKKNSDGSDKEGPQSFADYEIINHWDKDCPGSKKLGLPKGVKLHLRHINPM